MDEKSCVNREKEGGKQIIIGLTFYVVVVDDDDVYYDFFLNSNVSVILRYILVW